MDDAWVAQWGPFEKGTEQPFYQTMVDTKDRERPMMTFAAQENLELVSEGEGPAGDPVMRVDHPMMEKLFVDAPPNAGRHIVHEHLAAEYPEDF